MGFPNEEFLLFSGLCIRAGRLDLFNLLTPLFGKVPDGDLGGCIFSFCHWHLPRYLDINAENHYPVHNLLCRITKHRFSCLF